MTVLAGSTQYCPGNWGARTEPRWIGRHESEALEPGPHVCTGTARDAAETSPCGRAAAGSPHLRRDLVAHVALPNDGVHGRKAARLHASEQVQHDRLPKTLRPSTGARGRPSAGARSQKEKGSLRAPLNRRRRRLASARTRSRPRGRTSARRTTQWRSPHPRTAGGGRGRAAAASQRRAASDVVCARRMRF